MLTELAVKNAKPKKQVYRINDGKGLHLEVTPSGGKLWRWRYYFAGKQYILGLGKYPTVTLSEARKRRDEGLILIENEKHPARDRKSKKRKLWDDEQTKFKSVSEKWLEVKEKELNERYHEQITRMLERYVYPKIGDSPMSEVTTPDIVHVISPIADEGKVETANRIKLYISQIFTYGIQTGLPINNPALHLTDVLPSISEEHHASLPLDIVPDFLKELVLKEDSLGKLAVELITFTFVRTSELIPALWTEIDWDKALWEIPAERMKMKRAHIVPLSSQALATLKRLHKLTGHRKYIFYSHSSKSHHISNNTILKMLKLMGYNGRMTGHGFRTLASTILHQKEYSSAVIEKQLAHEDENKVRSAYNRAEYLPQRKVLMQDYADILDCMRKGKEFTRKVTP